MEPSPSSCMRVIAVPVYKRNWLLHGWNKENPQEQELDWRAADSLPDKLATACKLVARKVGNDVKQQWREIQVAKEGTFRSWLYKLGQFVLSREDPTETFLKHLPSNTTRLEVVYPAGWTEASVRRYLRLTALRRLAIHRRKLLGWGLVTLPQMPLILTPLPNVTLYFAMYRVLSHYQAVQGATLLRAALEREDALHVQRLYRASSVGTEGPPGPQPWWRWVWLRPGRSRRKPTAQQQQQWRAELEQREAQGKGPIVLFEPSPLLDSITQPQLRWRTPLGEDAVLQLSQTFEADSLKELYSRARNRGLLE